MTVKSPWQQAWFWPARCFRVVVFALVLLVTIHVSPVDALCTPAAVGCVCQTPQMTCSAYQNLEARIFNMSQMEFGDKRIASGPLKLLFHDAAEHDQHAEDPLGVDGCLNWEDPMNAEMVDTYQDEDIFALVDDLWLSYCSEISRADFIVMLAAATLRAYAGDILYNYKFPFAPYLGRTDRVTCTYRDYDRLGLSRLPRLSLNVSQSEVDRVLVEQMGLAPDHAATLMQAHVLAIYKTPTNAMYATVGQEGIWTDGHMLRLLTSTFTRVSAYGQIYPLVYNLPDDYIMRYVWRADVSPAVLAAGYYSPTFFLNHDMHPIFPNVWNIHEEGVTCGPLFELTSKGTLQALPRNASSSCEVDEEQVQRLIEYVSLPGLFWQNFSQAITALSLVGVNQSELFCPCGGCNRSFTTNIQNLASSRNEAVRQKPFSAIILVLVAMAIALLLEQEHQ
ncbi:uncharacterized protein MONBRDRAFT_7457 [Monosiga brevicollis MX1]|uniref:Uncharacterized protein n=1 Tax=Monosiga brevicollis TaxID=81824 RepID=A9UX08_MONBE|nr:uncharacterized protein MONBRDRAFT_7457 [Monosiga brevicollis MX1]EDQ90132.1 predicted protein [Monosiga brevicollis MX1]|eukprot:XP_001744899.1 hypothetical protein [Monosiga brevicollis MX1]